jgi:hypothetical protein
VPLVSIVVIRFRQKRVKLSGGGVSLKLAIPDGCIEFRKPAPELRQRHWVKGFDGLLEGFHIGHGLSAGANSGQSDAIRLTSLRHSSSRQRIAIGCSPAWFS